MSTPVQRQYWELKKQNPEAVLFFRLGDFYEMFFEDAQVASRVLGIVLTARHKGTENEMPMCGFPYHAHKEYLEKLIEGGYKVAIAEQIEDPDTKQISRKVVRIVTPGTVIGNEGMKPEKNSFLVAIDSNKKNWALAYSDLTTGDFRTCVFGNEISFFDELYKLNPQEILVPSRLFEDEKFCQKLPQTHITPRKNLIENNASEILKTHFGIKNLEVFGIEKISLLMTVSAQILEYLSETVQSDISHISKLIRYEPSDIMQLDAQTYKHLEIFEQIYQDEHVATLWSVFEKSFTAMGARKLRMWLEMPLISADKINVRAESVSEIFSDTDIQNSLRESLSKICDLERILARIVTGHGNARDLVFLRESFAMFPRLGEVCSKLKSSFLSSKSEIFNKFEKLYAELQQKLVDHPPVEITLGGIFRDGISTELDEYRDLIKNGKKWFDEFLNQKKKESGIHNLRLKYSKNFGYCFEVSHGQKDKVPEDWVRRQTLVNAERYTTPELVEYEEKTLSAEGKAFELEHRFFEELRKYVLNFIIDIQKASHSIGEIDAIMTLAKTAQKWRWTKPEITNDLEVFEVKKGRHPVVEKLSTEVFIANNLMMHSDSSRMHIITGPNMAGKSTFLRQNALIVFLAQIGSFVPAESVKMSTFDRIFTRVGASDNLAGGKSTFFVEMLETARILNSATEKSFIILDEIGRGTSTFDGISLAWAITEFLHDKSKSMTLFATHFHELIDLADGLSAGRNFHVSASQNSNGIVFLREIKEGGISDSFGIEVAKNAGLPKTVIKNARGVLIRLESEKLLGDQPNLFNVQREHLNLQESAAKTEIEKKIEDLDIEDMTPKKALDFLFSIRKQ